MWTCLPCLSWRRGRSGSQPVCGVSLRSPRAIPPSAFARSHRHKSQRFRRTVACRCSSLSSQKFSHPCKKKWGGAPVLRSATPSGKHQRVRTPQLRGIHQARFHRSGLLSSHHWSSLRLGWNPWRWNPFRRQLTHRWLRRRSYSQTSFWTALRPHEAILQHSCARQSPAAVRRLLPQVPMCVPARVSPVRHVPPVACPLPDAVPLPASPVSQ